MENIHYNSDIYEIEMSAELDEHIEYLITAGVDITDIIKMYPQYDKKVIDGIVERVSWFCWYGYELTEGEDMQEGGG